MTEAELIAFFQDLHRHPELAYEEVRTTKRIREVLENAGICCLPAGTDTGLIARIRGKQPGRVIALRADIDALPVTEESGLSYASEEAGKMHACGHDFHTACMVGAALAIKSREDELAGEVLVIFQPAEETCTGGKQVAASPVLQAVDEYYAGHTYPWFPAGTLGIRKGPVMASPDGFAVHIRGRGAHAGNPHQGIDPVPVAAALVLEAQTLVSRVKDAFEPAVLSITHLEAGQTWNVIPDEAFLEGTLRTLHQTTREDLQRRLTEMAEHVALAHGCTASVTWTQGAPPVDNDSGLCEEARKVAEELGMTVEEPVNTMGGEDFSEYLQHAPGVFIRVGTGGGYTNHHPRFTADPAALAPAARYFAELALRRAKG